MPADEQEPTQAQDRIGGPDLMAERISAARRQAGYRTAQDFAEDLQVSVWTVRSWESGKSQPRYDVLREISRLTRRPIAWFLGENAAQQVLGRAMTGLLERHQLRLQDEGHDLQDEAGVYGVAPLDGTAQRELNALSADAQEWGVLLRLSKPNAPVTGDQVTALHLALANLVRDLRPA